MRERAFDGSIRSLHHIRHSGSTSRILNLPLVHQNFANDAEFKSKPLFLSPQLNTSILIKHRLRPHEKEYFTDGRGIATKIVIPFSKADLKLGGLSVFCESEGYEHFLLEVSQDPVGLIRDRQVLDLIDSVPSLDPFLIRELLAQRGFDVARCYFSFSPADAEKMKHFVGQHIAKLVQIAITTNGADSLRSTSRLVDALLSHSYDERLDPLRQTMMLDGDAFREGMFSWKGFIYYKWQISQYTSELGKIVGEIRNLKVVGNVTMEEVEYLKRLVGVLQRGIRAEMIEVMSALKVYDDAFQDLSVNGRPLAFRRFLLNAPAMFVSLGERMGALSHIVTFWRYKFPMSTNLKVSAQDAMDILGEFANSISGVGLGAAK